MTTSEYVAALGGMVLLALAHYIASGKPPIFDSANRYPFFDMIRDGLRLLIGILYPNVGRKPEPPQDIPPHTPPDPPQDPPPLRGPKAPRLFRPDRGA